MIDFKYVFLIGLLAQEALRLPHRMRNKRDRQQKNFADDRSAGIELVLSLVAWTGLFILPLFCIFTNWLSFADYALPANLGWLGVLSFVTALILLWRAHVDLGTNWSPTLQIARQHTLVTQGIYRYLRHPIYASIWLAAIAQGLMLPNWIAGWSGIVAALLVQFIRIPREEQMMIDHFGDEYREYAKRTGGIIPKSGSK